MECLVELHFNQRVSGSNPDGAFMGWFEENEDGTMDYIDVLPNGEKWRYKNVYPISVDFGELESVIPAEISIGKTNEQASKNR